MSTIALSHKAAKLMKLCDLEGYKRLNDHAKRAAATRWCPRSCSPVSSREAGHGVPQLLPLRRMWLRVDGRMVGAMRR